ncbi:MAG: hypothetical protein HRU17_12465 [Polyangiaceae bacterium]|nr:hypothetical protein [Polyangiaceae bacterium]
MPPLSKVTSGDALQKTSVGLGPTPIAADGAEPPPNTRRVPNRQHSPLLGGVVGSALPASVEGPRPPRRDAFKHTLPTSDVLPNHAVQSASVEAAPAAVDPPDERDRMSSYPDVPVASIFSAGPSSQPAPRAHLHPLRFQLSIVGAAITGLVLLAAGFSGNSLLAITCFATSAVMFAVAAVAQSQLLFQMWEAIQDGHARCSPVEALSYLFVPVFNIYWVFQVFGGYVTDYNAYVARHRMGRKPLSLNLILASLSLPVFGIILHWVVVRRLCEAVNALHPVAPTEASEGL